MDMMDAISMTKKGVPHDTLSTSRKETSKREGRMDTE